MCVSIYKWYPNNYYTFSYLLHFRHLSVVNREAINIWHLRFCNVSISLSMARHLTLEQRCKLSAWQEIIQFPSEINHKFQKVYGHHTVLMCSTIYAIHSRFSINNRSIQWMLRSNKALTVPTSGCSKPSSESLWCS